MEAASRSSSSTALRAAGARSRVIQQASAATGKASASTGLSWERAPYPQARITGNSLSRYNAPQVPGEQPEEHAQPA